MDVKKLLTALDDETNENLLNFTTKKIKEMNLKILQELHLSKTDTLELLGKLKEYKYVDEMNDLKYGAYIRWISIDNPEKISLTKGGIFCEMKITDKGVFCVCKNFGYSNKHFQISMDKNLIFQRLTNQELIFFQLFDFYG
jgi:hypothetical protein